MMEPWERHLKHEKDCRDALIACGNPAPIEPDPEGGMIRVICQRFDGKIFWNHLESTGHNSAEFNQCRCKRAK